jgi:hypothetical protein
MYYKTLFLNLSRFSVKEVMPGGRKIWSGTSKVQPVGLEKRGSATMIFSRFRETYFFSAGKKSKQKTPRLRLML